jgi:hypothetical protein
MVEISGKWDDLWKMMIVMGFEWKYDLKTR